ncbi:MAG: adenosine kinase [Magnetovibrio sp.]|nr:adenosine kinase [Magnetovibrio sp.]
MSDARYAVCGIGNAIVDVLSHEDDDFLTRHSMTKGTMALIDADAADKLYDDMGPGIECSGGSAANTIAGIASLGGTAAFIGKVKDDQLGKVFRHDINAIGVHFPTDAADDGLSTARCLIHVTPDAERTMNTFLGACVDLGPGDVDEDVVRASQVTYLEGYLWDKDNAKAAFVKAAELAHEAGREVSLSLSDPFCVDRHRDSFLELVEGHVDILFANEDEIMSLYQVDTFDAALQHVRGHCSVAALTRGSKGSVVVKGDEIHIGDAEPDIRVVDTTGAGDAYAAGFLFGYTDGGQNDLAHCARLGSIASAEIISHFGARPETPLKELVAKKIG